VDDTLRRYPNVRVKVFAVWEPILPTDLSAPTSRTLARLSDRRVRQYWDADHLLAKRLAQDARSPQPVPDCCTRKGVLRDLIAIYPGGGQWTDRIPVASVFTGPVVDEIDALTKALSGK
jgi:hypothetical protein